MQQFLDLAASKLGADPSTVTSATQGLLGGIREQAGNDAFSSALGNVPGLSGLMDAGPAQDDAPAAGGMLGGLAGALGGGGGGLAGALGGGGGGLGGALGGLAGAVGGDAKGLVALLGSSGLKAEQIAPFAQMLIGFLQKQAGEDAVGGLLSKVPMLAGMAGGGSEGGKGILGAVSGLAGLMD